MDGMSIALLLGCVLFAACIDWKELTRVFRDGGWFVVLVYVVIGIALVKLVQGTIL